ncbi:hypothetical protein [Cnuella takakiae]|nr:hypothetical protein [Cnuella takakiae]
MTATKGSVIPAQAGISFVYQSTRVEKGYPELPSTGNLCIDGDAETSSA